MNQRIPQPFTFESLQMRHRITAELEALTALRIGADKSLDAASTDLPIIRDGLGRPYLPGSSLKGVLRSGLEAILRSLDVKEKVNLWSCDLFINPCIGEPEREQRRENETIPLETVCKEICTVCSLFGSPFLGGRVFVQDLPIIAESYLSSELRDGVAINRDLGTAQGGFKYDFEVLPPGTRFKLEILIENADDLRLALVLKSLELLDQGEILVGGFTSRGLGRVCLQKPELEKTDAKLLLAGIRYSPLDYQSEQEAATKKLGQLLETGG